MQKKIVHTVDQSLALIAEARSARVIHEAQERRQTEALRRHKEARERVASAQPAPLPSIRAASPTRAHMHDTVATACASLREVLNHAQNATGAQHAGARACLRLLGEHLDEVLRNYPTTNTGNP